MATTKTKKPKTLTRAEYLKYFEGRLLEERARVVKELGIYNDTFNVSTQDQGGEVSMLLLPSGRSRDRRHGARKGVPLREPRRDTFPLAY